MTKLINKYKSFSIKDKLILLYALNLTDWIFTLYLLNIGFCYEANVFMVDVVNSPLLSAILKIFVPGILFLYISKRLKEATPYQLKISNKLINVAILLYITINVFHILWIILSPLMNIYFSYIL